MYCFYAVNVLFAAFNVLFLEFAADVQGPVLQRIKLCAAVGKDSGHGSNAVVYYPLQQSIIVHAAVGNGQPNLY